MKKFLPVWGIYRKLYIGCSLLLVVQKTVLLKNGNTVLI